MSDHELDQILDAALPGYLAEPPAGMAPRILAHVHRPRRWPWVASLAAAAAIAVAVLMPRPAAVDVAPPPLVALAPEAPAVHITPVPVHRARPVRPAPLSRRERALIAFVQSNPELARQVFVEGPRRMAEPLELQPIAIQPLTIEPLAPASGGE